MVLFVETIQLLLLSPWCWPGQTHVFLCSLRTHVGGTLLIYTSQDPGVLDNLCKQNFTLISTHINMEPLLTITILSQKETNEVNENLPLRRKTCDKLSLFWLFVFFYVDWLFHIVVVLYVFLLCVTGWGLRGYWECFLLCESLFK